MALAVNLSLICDKTALQHFFEQTIREHWAIIEAIIRGGNPDEEHPLCPGLSYGNSYHLRTSHTGNCLVAPHWIDLVDCLQDLLPEDLRQEADRSAPASRGYPPGKYHDLADDATGFAGRRLMCLPEVAPTLLHNEAIQTIMIARSQGNRTALVAVGGGYGIGSFDWPQPEHFAEVAGVRELFDLFGCDYMADEAYLGGLPIAHSEVILTLDDLMAWTDSHK